MKAYCINCGVKKNLENAGGYCPKTGWGHEWVPAFNAEPRPILPTDAATRKSQPIARGVLDYFPRAMASIAHLSKVGSDQHNPGEEMRWAKEKSPDHADCIVRHLIERGKRDTDGELHSTKLAWRALALLEIELETAASK